MANLAFKRAIAGMSAVKANKVDTSRVSASSGIAREDDAFDAATTGRSGLQQLDQDPELLPDRISLSEKMSALRIHKLAIALRPIASNSSTNGGRSMMLTASRWEVRKAILSLCCTPPTTFEVEATDKTAIINISFSVGSAAEDLSRKLQGVTVKIKGVKLHAFVREVSESSALSEGEDWADTLLGPQVKPTGRSGAFDRLPPGRRPDTIVLRGIPVNWLAEKGRAEEGMPAPDLELIMGKLGAVRSVEVKPSVPGDPAVNPAAAKAAAPTGGGGAASNRGVDFDVHALLENMPQPRALAVGSGSSGGGRAGGGRSGGGGGSRRRGEGGLAGGGISVDLHVDAWVQFTSFSGFERALKTLRGRVLQKAGADMLCEYRLGVDVTGYMTEERRRERVAIRAREAQEKERRLLSIDAARGQLIGLREGLQGLRDAVKEDGRSALEDAAKPTVSKVTGYVEEAEGLLDARVVDEPAATRSVSRARGEIAIARLSIRKARQAVDKAEEEARKQLAQEKDKELRGVAAEALKELEGTFSKGMALVAEDREHSGIKPQADRAAALLRELSEACSKEGGSQALRSGKLVVETRNATKTASTRACMLQRYLNTCARLKELRAAFGAMILPGTGDTTINNSGGSNIDNTDSSSSNNNNNTSNTNNNESNTDSNNNDSNSNSSDSVHLEGGVNSIVATAVITAGATAGGSAVPAKVGDGSGNGRNKDCVLTAQLEVADDILSRELGGLSEGDLLLIWESAEEALERADGMLETAKLMETVRGRLADTKSAVARGDPLLKSSEGVMRLMAASVMSTARAQREGEATGRSASLSVVGERWRSFALGANSDVAAAEQEVERVAEDLRDRRQREEKEMALRRAEEERRLREEEALKADLLARAAEQERLARKQAKARIAAMELRKAEMTLQVKNKAARHRLREWFRERRTSENKPESARDDDSEAIGDRWTLEEGLEANDSPASTPAAAAAAAATAPLGGASRVPAPSGNIEETPPGDVTRAGRWSLTDGASDLAERGIEAVGAGSYLPSSLLPRPDEGGRRGRKRSRQARAVEEEPEWLELVSKRVRSAVVGGIPAGSWADQVGDDEVEDATVSIDGADGGRDANGGNNNRPRGDTQSPPELSAADSSGRGIAPVVQKGGNRDISALGGAAATSTPIVGGGGKGGGGSVGSEMTASKAVDGGKVEAALRQRLLAAMGKLGKPKPRSH